MVRKRPARDPQPEQLVFPFQLRVGDVILEDGVRTEVVGQPTSMVSGKMTRAWVRREGETQLDLPARYEAEDRPRSGASPASLPGGGILRGAAR
jgi:hypothetical protein